MKAYIALSCIAVFTSGEFARALPPLGVTHIGTFSRGKLEIIEGSAYVGADGLVASVDSTGSVTLTQLAHPDYGTPASVTRVVEGPDGGLYVGANFDPVDPIVVPGNPALFRLDEPTAPVVTWELDVDLDTDRYPWIVGVDRNLRGVGNIKDPSYIPAVEPDNLAAEFHLDGTIEYLELPRGGFLSYVGEVSPGGYALGEADVPGTIGTGVALWSPSGNVSFVSEAGIAESLRDRLDGRGVNIGYIGPAIKYGEESLHGIDVDGNEVIVSHSDFAVVETSFVPPRTYAAFFPGIVPGEPTQAVPLLDVFPELASVNFDRITDLAAVDGYIYMTVVGEDGLYLFGARDPSVIPEPSTVGLALVVCGGVFAWRYRRVARR